MILIIFLHLCALTYALSVDTQLQEASDNRTILQRTMIEGWVNGSAFRGTSSILWSCVLTIIASIYTAIHPNIRPERASEYIRLWDKVKWAFRTLLAPELVLQAAFAQRSEARNLVKHLQGIEKQDLNQSGLLPEGKTRFARLRQIVGLRASKHSKLKSKYDMKYAFWVVMGGFVIDVGDIHDDYRRITLTANGFIFLTKQIGHLRCFSISKEEIADRSKANYISKGLVIIQISWMLIQALERLVAGYPVTLLEIHTMVHVLCAFCIYFLWWSKPLDVEEPIVVDLSDYKDLVAFMTMTALSMEEKTTLQSRAQNPRLDTSSDRNSIESYTDSFLIREPEIEHLLMDRNVLLGAIYPHTLSPLYPAAATEENATRATTMLPEATHHDHPATVETQSHVDETLVQAGTFHSSGFGFELDRDVKIVPKATKRWLLSSQALRRYGLVPELSDQQVIKGRVFKDLDYMLDPKRTFDSISETPGNIIGLGVALLFLPVLYGGLHIAAWNAEFPTAIESLLWKISALAVMFTGMIIVFALVLIIRPRQIALMMPPGQIFTREPESVQVPLSNLAPTAEHSNQDEELSQEELPRRRWVRILSSCSASIDPTILSLILCLITVLVVVLFFCARMYLVVESFISLRKVPLGAFAATPWTQSIPHI